MPDQPTAAELQAKAIRWLDRAADELKHIRPDDYSAADMLAAAEIGAGYNALAHYEFLVESRAADLKRIADNRRDDLERITAADRAQRRAEAIVEEAHVSMKRLADVQIGAWGEQYPHLVEALVAGAEVKSDA